eukprot:1082453-Prymnesium_polylepis.1
MQIAHGLGQHDSGCFGLGGEHLGQPSGARRNIGGIIQRRRWRDSTGSEYASPQRWQQDGLSFGNVSERLGNFDEGERD